MKHLIIGHGNMGRRYEQILKTLNQEVECVDLGWDIVRWYRWPEFDSVLICTPPATHLDIIAKIPIRIPVFCEKPLMVGLDQVFPNDFTLRPRTLMSCPWLFCGCVPKEFQLLTCFYPSRCPHRFLDIIHFMPFFEEPFNIDAGITTEYEYAEIWSRDRIAGVRLGPQKTTFIDQIQIHRNGPCLMFEKMMAHWLNVIEGKEESIMPFARALDLNKKLLTALDKKS